jgi:hypothetical protein
VLDASEAFEAWCVQQGYSVRRMKSRLVVEVEGAANVNVVLERALADGLAIGEVVPRTETLEDLFVREAIDEGSTGSSGAAA